MPNPYERMREDVINMQKWFSRYIPEEERSKDVQEAVDSLLKTRQAFEKLWLASR
jgi:hypothetical protein